MIIGDLHLIRVSIFPDEAEAIAVVDPDAVLSGAAAFQCLQRVTWRAEIVKRPGRVQLKQFSNRNLFDGLKLPGTGSQKDLLGFGISKGADHALDRISIDDKQSRRFTMSDTIDRITVPAHARPEQIVPHPTLGLDALLRRPHS